MISINCPICGKLFEKQGFYEVCQSCFSNNQSEFEKVRDYLYNYSNKNIQEVANATGVSISKINEFIRQGRLTRS
ncbi:MAG: Flagellar operon protein YvyF [Clostridia bacterium]|jgi:sarcosine oxidase delta subunit|nr:Flagellar operon protein YvyF [Clostridia bacterium]